jgi:hypothetical protein
MRNKAPSFCKYCIFMPSFFPADHWTIGQYLRWNKNSYAETFIGDEMEENWLNVIIPL